MPILGRSCGLVCPFLELHDRQAVTVFVQVSFPPCDLGMTWSRDRSLMGNMVEQYCKRGVKDEYKVKTGAVKRLQVKKQQ